MSGKGELRQARAAHFGKHAEAVREVGVEVGECRVFVAGLSRVELEDQQVLLVEAEFHGAQVRERVDEQTGGDDQQQRNGDLRHHQDAAEAKAEAEPARSHVSRTGPDFLQCRREIHFGGLQRGGKAEDDAGGDRQREREAQHGPVQTGAQDGLSVAIAEQQGDEANAAERDEQPERAAAEGQQHALRQQLPDDAHPSRAHAQADRHLAAAGGSAGEQQVGDVGAGNGENQADHGHQDEQRFGVLAAQGVDAGSAFFQPELGQARALFGLRYRALCILAELTGELGLRLLQADARLQAAHHFHPEEVAVEEAALFFFSGLRREQRGRVQGEEDGRVLPGIETEEAGSGDADDGERDVVDQQLLANGGGVCGIAPLPVAVAEDGDGRGPGAVVFIEDQTSGGGRHAEAGEVTAGSEHAVHQFGLAFGDKIDMEGGCVREESGKDGVFRVKRRDGGEREVGADAAAAVAVHGSHDAARRPGAARGTPLQNDEFAGIPHRERTKQNRIHEAVNRRVGPDAEGEREHRHRREKFVRRHGPQTVAQVLRELFPKRPCPHSAAILLQKCDVAKWRGPLLLGPESQMMLQFFVEFALILGAAEQEPQPAKKFAHTASITRAMAPITRPKSCSSRSSCLRPSGVSW